MSLPHLALAATTALAGAEAAEEKAPPIIDIDGTVLIQFALFVAMFLVLRAFLFKPYLKMRAERAEKIEGAEAKAVTLGKRADELEAQYKAKVARARASADEERARLQSEGRVRETELLGQARTRAQGRIQATRQQIAEQVQTARGELEQRASTLGHALATKLLGREV